MQIALPWRALELPLGEVDLLGRVVLRCTTAQPGMRKGERKEERKIELNQIRPARYAGLGNQAIGKVGQGSEDRHTTLVRTMDVLLKMPS